MSSKEPRKYAPPSAGPIQNLGPADTTLPGHLITSGAYERLIHYCRITLPQEACGVLAASAQGRRIDTVIPITNGHPEAATSFSFSPGEWIRACYSMQKNRQKLVGFFHSHPLTPPFPSTRDLNGITGAPGSALQGDGLSYWIVSLQNPTDPKLGVYRMEGTRLIPLMFT